MNTIQAKQLGDKYILLDLLGIGGMAEVYRAKQLGQKGFAKQIVIKKLLPQAAQDKEMVNLFIGEARLAAMLQHENVAAIYDFGEIGGSYFLAMEYLSGVDLNTLMKKTRELGEPLEIQYALMIAAKICEGMEYAHRLKDFQNKPLNLIHRDLTPHNIFITYAGKVKVFDFGVAKAEILDNKTQAGVVKGKLSYMSPEQISGEKIDSRSDIFSIGILLYEMLSGKRMYMGDTATLIQKCLTVDFVPLREINPDLPSGLYTILDKALERDREKRYQNCGQMQTDIEDLMFSMGKRTDAKNLQNYIREMFGEEYKAAQIQAAAAMDESTMVMSHPEQDKTVVMQMAPAEETIVDDTGKAYRPRTRVFVPRLLKDKRFLGGTALALLVLVAFIIFTLLNKNESTSDSTTASQTTKDFWLSSSENAGRSAIDNKVKKLFKLAENALKDDKLLEPPGSSAISYYREIASLDPENNEARKGLSVVEIRYIKRVEKALLDKRLAESDRLISAGLEAFPNSPNLQTLRQKAASERILVIDELKNKAELNLAQNRLIEPENDCAVKYYTEILNLDPGNVLALQGLNKIGDSLVVQAELEYKENNLKKANLIVDNGLQIVPQHKKLLELKKELFSLNTADGYAELAEKNIDSGRLEEAQGYINKGLSIAPRYEKLLALQAKNKKKKEGDINVLAEKARQRLAENNLTTPVGDSALTYLDKIKAIDPENMIAETGYREIADRYATLGEEAYRTFQYEACREYVNKGLKVMPGHSRLLELKRELSKPAPEKFLKGVGKNIGNGLEDLGGLFKQ